MSRQKLKYESPTQNPVEFPESHTTTMANRHCLRTLTRHGPSVLSSSNSSSLLIQTRNPLRISTCTSPDLFSCQSITRSSYTVFASLGPTCQSSPEEEAAAIGYKLFGSLKSFGRVQANSNIRTNVPQPSYDVSVNPRSLLNTSSKPGFLLQAITPQPPSSRGVSTMVESTSLSGVAQRIKYKRLDKTARHIMQILDKEAVGEVKEQKEVPDIQPGHIIQLKVEVPENKRRVSILKGIVIARRNAGLHTTFRLRRLVAGVGIESLFPLYSPNIKEIKVLDKKKVRRAKLYYLRDKMNALRK